MGSPLCLPWNVTLLDQLVGLVEGELQPQFRVTPLFADFPLPGIDPQTERGEAKLLVDPSLVGLEIVPVKMLSDLMSSPFADYLRRMCRFVPKSCIWYRGDQKSESGQNRHYVLHDQHLSLEKDKGVEYASP